MLRACQLSFRKEALGRDLAPRGGTGPISLTPRRSPGYLREGESEVIGGGGLFLALPPFDTGPCPVDSQSQAAEWRAGEMEKVVSLKPACRLVACGLNPA